MDLTVARSGTINFFDGQAVWDDPVQQQQVRLLPTALRIIAQVSGGNDAETVVDSLSREGHHNARALMSAMLGAGILQSAADADRQDLMSELASWGPGVAHFHFSGRTTAETVFVDERVLDLELQRRSLDGDLPTYFAEVDGARIDLDTLLPDSWSEQCSALLSLMRARRSRRVYSTTTPFPKKSFSLLLTALHTPTHIARDHLGRPTKVRRVVPSSGGLQAVDIGVVVRSVEGIEAGCYRFDREAGQLIAVGPGLDQQSWVHALGEQAWVGDASFALVYFGRTRLIRWKYARTRAYRSLFLEAGHQSYAAYLLAEALGVAHTFIGAVRDETLEGLLKLDPRHEFVIGASVFGMREPETDGTSEDLTSFEWERQALHGTGSA